MSDERERDPWERRAGESVAAYEAFRAFRDLGPTRRLEALVDDDVRTLRRLRRWKQDNRWEVRVRAWDAEVHRVEDQQRLEQVRTMDRTHQTAARVLIAAGLRALSQFESLTPHQAARFVDLGTRLERAALLGGHLEPLGALIPVDDDDGLSPLERIARDLTDTA